MPMSEGLSFRYAGNDDIGAIVALVESAYRGDSSRQGWTTEADMLDGRRIDEQRIHELVSDPLTRIVLGEHDGVIVACCELRRESEYGYFGMFAVRPDQQGKSLGKHMLGEAERIVGEEWACRGMRMTVIDIRDELIAWYQRRGYTRTGEYRPFPYGDERFGVPKRDDLRFEVLYKPFPREESLR